VHLALHVVHEAECDPMTAYRCASTGNGVAQAAAKEGIKLLRWRKGLTTRHRSAKDKMAKTALGAADRLPVPQHAAVPVRPEIRETCECFQSVIRVEDEVD